MSCDASGSIFSYTFSARTEKRRRLLSPKCLSILRFLFDIIAASIIKAENSIVQISIPILS
jgi:hypothetical protein